MEKYLEALNNFIGYGCPNKADIFLFGIEEKLIENYEMSSEEEERLDIYLNKYKYINSPYYFFYDVAFSELYVNHPCLKEKDIINSTKTIIYKSYKIVIGKKDIDFSSFGSSKYPNVFIGNIHAFPRKGTSSNYEKEIADYLSKESTSVEREELILDFIKEYIISKNKTLIIFGKQLENKMLLEKRNIKFIERHFELNAKRNSKIYYKSEHDKIYLVKHPSYNWLSNDQLEELNKLISL